jgi:hypothetical protein
MGLLIERCADSAEFLHPTGEPPSRPSGRPRQVIFCSSGAREQRGSRGRNWRHRDLLPGFAPPWKAAGPFLTRRPAALLVPIPAVAPAALRADGRCGRRSPLRERRLTRCNRRGSPS